LLSIVALGLIACSGSENQGVEIPTLTPFDDVLALRLAGIAVTASQVRGLGLHEGIEQGTLSGAQLLDYYREAATKARLQDDVNYDALNTTFRLLHMIGPEDSLLDLSEEAAPSVLGFYAFTEDQLVLVSDTPDQLSLDDEATLAHEYVHSFQDKEFDLEKLLERVEKEEREKANTEYGDTLDALIEGDATVAQFQYVEQKVGPEGLREWLSSVGGGAKDEESANGGDEASGPPAFARYAAFPYTYGSTFVRHLYDDGGWEAVNAAYENPPKTEEQVLHPEKYLKGEEPIAISLRDLSEDLGKGWRQEIDSVFGEFDVYNWLRSTLDNEFQATSAAAGWGGGRIAVYANDLEEDRVLVHLALMWDSKQETREFYSAFGDVLPLIDPEPTILDPSLQIVGWEAEDEIGRAWVDRVTFQMIVAVRQEDLETANRVVRAPDSIPESGYILQEPVNPARASTPLRRLRDVLLRAPDLPPGFVLVQSGDLGVQNPVFSQNMEERFALFTDARSPGDGVVSTVSRVRGRLPAGVSWAQLEAEDPRLMFDVFAGEFALGGEVRSFASIPAEGIGEGALGARAEVTSPDGATQLLQMIYFGRRATTALVITFQDVESDEMDVVHLARTMDERLKRYQP
jgi:hypothetical protein